ncbi:unnamed protein product [Gadus morhua 'NCC']
MRAFGLRGRNTHQTCDQKRAGRIFYRETPRIWSCNHPKTSLGRCQEEPCSRRCHRLLWFGCVSLSIESGALTPHGPPSLCVMVPPEAHMSLGVAGWWCSALCSQFSRHLPPALPVLLGPTKTLLHPPVESTLPRLRKQRDLAGPPEGGAPWDDVSLLCGGGESTASIFALAPLFWQPCWFGTDSSQTQAVLIATGLWAGGGKAPSPPSFQQGGQRARAFSALPAPRCSTGSSRGTFSPS